MLDRPHDAANVVAPRLADDAEVEVLARAVHGDGDLPDLAARPQSRAAQSEIHMADRYIEDISRVRHCNLTLDRIADAALSVDESAALIATVREEFQARVHA